MIALLIGLSFVLNSTEYRCRLSVTSAWVEPYNTCLVCSGKVVASLSFVDKVLPVFALPGES